MSILLLNTLKTGYIRLTLFFPMFPFDPTENIRKPKVFWCFQGGSKGYAGKKWVKTFARKLMRYMKNIAIIKLYLYLVYLPSCVSCAPSFVAWQANKSKFLGWTIHANLINNPEYIHNAKQKKKRNYAQNGHICNSSYINGLRQRLSIHYLWTVYLLSNCFILIRSFS